MNLITVNEVKSILQISDSSNDSFINTMIPIVEDFVLKYCNLTQEKAERYPALKLPIAKMINYQLDKPKNVTSERIGNYAISFGANSYPPHIMLELKQFRLAKFVQSDDSNPYYEDWIIFEDETI